MFRKGDIASKHAYFVKGSMTSENKTLGHPHHHGHFVAPHHQAGEPDEERKKRNALEKAVRG